jgi:ADP-heptose:LPS heptosyltransferase
MALPGPLFLTRTQAARQAMRGQAGPTRHCPRIGVFRALVLGDMLCALPALKALRAAHPDAQLTLIGLPWAAELAARLSFIDEFIPFPGFPGLPEQRPDLAALGAFFAKARAHRFDLLLQMHGSGSITNPIVLACRARHTAGFYLPGAHCPDTSRFIEWPRSGHEIERCLALTDALGMRREGLHESRHERLRLELPLTDGDHAQLGRLWPVRQGRPSRYVCIHPGAQLRSRRWPVERFTAVADGLAADGFTIVLTGTAGEAVLGERLRLSMKAPVVDFIGRTNLWTLAALIENARLLVCNDTGVSHIAAALGTPSVVVSMGSDVARWAPLDARRHRVLWHDLPCRPCAHESCPYAHECAQAIHPQQVLAEARQHLSEQGELEWMPPLPRQADACASLPGMCTATISTT